MITITIDEKKLKELIESDLILSELNAYGVDNWSGYDFIHYPTEEEINMEFEKYI